MILTRQAIRLIVSFNLLLVSLSGCSDSSIGSKESAQNINLENAKSKVPPIPEANVFIDEIMLARPYAVIGGTVQNIGGRQLEKLSIEIELRRRDDNRLVKREVSIQPNDLAAGEKGKFSLRVLSDEWGGSRVSSLRSETLAQEIAFNPLPGAKRPAEKLPAGKVTDGAITTTKRPKTGGEEFLNTPDTPVKVP